MARRRQSTRLKRRFHDDGSEGTAQGSSTRYFIRWHCISRVSCLWTTERPVRVMLATSTPHDCRDVGGIWPVKVSGPVPA